MGGTENESFNEKNLMDNLLCRELKWMTWSRVIIYIEWIL